MELLARNASVVSSAGLEFMARGVVMGVVGSAAIDAYALVMRRVFHVSTLDYALLGRWIGHMPQGQFVHARIGAASPVRGERLLGWVAHYSIGVTFAFVLLALMGREWVAVPTVLPALAVGVATIAAPWLVMQPAFGMGVAGSRTASPGAGRLRNLGSHVAFGIGLYVSAVVLAFV